ncbi:MAG: hypothetical protein IJ421_01210, partial [Prevotella sp.]|nr:hypothetical protein [Prevotella sp.]
HWLKRGGTFDSATGGTFQTDTDGTNHSDIPGTFESDMGGTFKPLQSIKSCIDFGIYTLSTHSKLDGAIYNHSKSIFLQTPCCVSRHIASPV